MTRNYFNHHKEVYYEPLKKGGDNSLKPCSFCGKSFVPNKYNASRQKYCVDVDCQRQRNIIRSRVFRKQNPNYFQKSSHETSYRTKPYNHQRDRKRKLDSLALKVSERQKRVFVDNAKTVVSLLEFYFMTFLGMTSFASGGLRQTSAFSLSNLLKLFYKDGVSLINSDINLKQKLEVLHEFVTESNKSFSSEELAEILQLGGSPPSSRGTPEEVEPRSRNDVPLSSDRGRSFGDELLF